MKKVLSMIAALFIVRRNSSANRIIQKCNRQNREAKPAAHNGSCAGLNIMNFSGDGAEGADSNIGYNATFGYQKPLGSTGGYWGMEFGLGSPWFQSGRHEVHGS